MSAVFFVGTFVIGIAFLVCLLLGSALAGTYFVCFVDDSDCPGFACFKDSDGIILAPASFSCLPVARSEVSAPASSMFIGCKLFFLRLRFVTDATDAAPMQKTAIEGAIINGTQIFKRMALSSSSVEQIISTYFKGLSPC